MLANTITYNEYWNVVALTCSAVLRNHHASGSGNNLADCLPNIVGCIDKFIDGNGVSIIESRPSMVVGDFYKN